MPRTARWPHAHATSPSTCLLRIALRAQPTPFIARCCSATFSKTGRTRDLYPQRGPVDHIAALAANEPHAWGKDDRGPGPVRSRSDGKPLTYARIVPIFLRLEAAGLLQRHEESRAIRRPTRPAQPAPKDGPRINEEIRVREVQLIDHSGHNLGPVEIQIALDKAQEVGLDLVEIAPNSSPPVCKILDYGKYKYQAQKK